MTPFWLYYGGKFRIAPKYPVPEYRTIIEPFAGAAGYATRFPDRDVILIDENPIIANLWKWLIRVSPSDIRKLPLLKEGQTIKELSICQEAKWLLGFWVSTGCAEPCQQASTRMKDDAKLRHHWGGRIREKIARQVQYIRHWKIKEGSYRSAPDIKAMWFVDPPYQKAGYRYKHSSTILDFDSLATWCMARKGTTVVCENEGASWLPFQSFCKATSQHKDVSEEVIFIHRTSQGPPPGRLI